VGQPAGKFPNQSHFVTDFFLSDTRKAESQIVRELIKMVRELIGPIAAFHVAAAVRGLPRTRSGKTARKSIADLARNKFVKVKDKIYLTDTSVATLK
jgi:acyl-coenzyme A synthetase/AMP-(fatty) acid ligase